VVEGVEEPAATPIRLQIAELLKIVEEDLSNETLLAAVVVVRTNTRVQTYQTTESQYYELLGLLEVAKNDLISMAKES